MTTQKAKSAALEAAKDYLERRLAPPREIGFEGICRAFIEQQEADSRPSVREELVETLEAAAAYVWSGGVLERDRALEAICAALAKVKGTSR